MTALSEKNDKPQKVLFLTDGDGKKADRGQNHLN